MLCQACGKKTATTHVKTIVNGKLTEFHLCPDCAKQKGYNNLFSGWSMDLGNLLGGFWGNAQGGSQVTRCPTCGASFEEITRFLKIQKEYTPNTDNEAVYHKMKKIFDASYYALESVYKMF